MALLVAAPAPPQAIWKIARAMEIRSRISASNNHTRSMTHTDRVAARRHHCARASDDFEIENTVVEDVLRLEQLRATHPG